MRGRTLWQTPPPHWWLLALLLGVVPSLRGQADYARSPLDYGDSPVGFAHHRAVDSSRVYRRVQDYSQRLQFREVPISRWYPAVATTGQRLRVGDYLQVLKEEEEWEDLPADYVLDFFYYPRNAVTETNAAYPTRAFRSAVPAPGRYPVVLYAPSYQASSAENFMLCEYLASQGYVVLAAPSRGERTMRLTGGTAEDAGAQSRDLQYLFGYAAGLANTDIERVYTVGFSFGGLSNVPFAMANRFVDGVISLDGSIKYNLAAAAALPGFSSENLEVPFVHFRQKPIPDTVLVADDIDKALARNFAFFDSLTAAPAHEFGSPDLTHGQFASFGLLFEPRDERQDHPAERIQRGYHDLCRTVLLTLRRMEVYGETGHWDAEAFVMEATAAGFELFRSLPAPPPTAAGTSDFFDAVRDAGFTKLDSVYESFLRRDEAFTVPEGALNTLGLQPGLSSSATDGEAGTAVLDFAVRRYPESANLHDSLATVYFQRGVKDKAIFHYERSLALYPGNDYARRQLELLRR